MTEHANRQSISAVFHLSKKISYSRKNLYKCIASLFNQYEQLIEVIFLDEMNDAAVREEISRMNTEGNPVKYVTGKYITLGSWLNAAFKLCTGAYVVYIDNTGAEVYLKNSASATFLLTAERHPRCGMIYGDYEIENNGKIHEIHLLKHHPGRVRDNQDYGRVLVFNKSAINKCGGFDKKLQSNTLYDIRLRLAERTQLIHVANRYTGSLYRVVTEGKGHNVFDYLLASKESQIEAEKVLSEHLKRMKAFLAPGRFYGKRPAAGPRTHLTASVIIPVNNRAQFIPIAIESVLNQTIQNIEVIIMVNGGSDDPTIAAVKEYMVGGVKYDSSKPEVRLIVLDINNIGLCLNLGAKAARGEYYVQLDSDDRLKPEAIEKILEVFKSDPKIGMVIGSYEVWQMNETDGKITRVKDIPVVTHDEWTEDNGRNNLLRINGAGAPRSIPISVIKDIGFFGVNDEPFARNYGEDYELVLKISERHRIGRIWEPIYDVVRHRGGTDHSIDQVTIDRNDEAKDYMRLEAIKRRKKLNSGKK
jgi:glycosyltransferase involved in cell wall biosynthesis